ncbi:MAG TPA: hypothetical protein VHG52_13125 [Thermomicrobiales bacterium]|nr:hypothetical protein [Thermomicrobiales bacterium]
MADYRPVGTIVRVQIQRSSLKVDGDPRRYYTPEPILSVAGLDVSEGTIEGSVDGRPMVDVHSASHPDSRNRGNGNMLSVGFTGHYELMRGRFGSHLVDGIAGENILVEHSGKLTLADVERGLVVERPDGQRIEFGTVSVAHPCVEFSRFCLNDLNAHPKQVSETLKFLDGGTRGFYGIVTSPLPVRIEEGDLLLARA